MPITPFHFGPGLMFRAVTRHVSLGVFVLVNCVIDIEPILAFLITGDPQHRFFHTYLGTTLAAVVVGLLARKPLEAGLCWWNRQLSPAQTRWFGCGESIASHSLWIGALAGAWSHIWLDAFMHVDVEPWWPMTTGNTAQGQIDMTELHVILVITGLVGVLLLGWQRVKTNLPVVATLGNWSGRLIVVALLLFVSYFYYSLDTGKERVSAVCTQMKPGMTYSELIALAKNHGLGPGVPRPDAKLVYLAELRTYGRHACRVELDNGVVKNASYNYAD